MNFFSEMKNLQELLENIKQGLNLSKEAVLELVNECTADELCRLADSLREHFSGKKMDTCSIINARSGRCSEDCKWCSQSSFHRCDVEIYPLVDEQTCLDMAQYNEAKGIRRFSLVTSGRAMSGDELERAVEIFKSLKEKTSLKLCASMGLLNKEQLQKLRDAGVERYHCNIETAPSYFGQLCTKHTQQEKFATLKWAEEVGMTVCSGGIIGMGETMEQRVEMAVTLRDMGVKSIPLNVLNPIAGTKLENMPQLSDDELIKSFAMFRIVNPEADIRFAGGRIKIKHIQRKLMECGVSAAIVGDMLTTIGCGIDDDFSMFAELGREV